MKKVSFTPLQIKILNMCLADDDRVQSLYAVEEFEHINLADVFRKQIRIKLAQLLNLDYDFVRDVVTKTDRKWIIKKNGKKARIGIYRIANEWKGKINALINPMQDEVKKTSE